MEKYQKYLLPIGTALVCGGAAVYMAKRVNDLETQLGAIRRNEVRHLSETDIRLIIQQMMREGAITGPTAPHGQPIMPPGAQFGQYHAQQQQQPQHQLPAMTPQQIMAMQQQQQQRAALQQQHQQQQQRFAAMQQQQQQYAQYMQQQQQRLAAMQQQQEQQQQQPHMYPRGAPQQQQQQQPRMSVPQPPQGMPPAFMGNLPMPSMAQMHAMFQNMMAAEDVYVGDEDDDLEDMADDNAAPKGRILRMGSLARGRDAEDTATEEIDTKQAEQPVTHPAPVEANGE